MKNAITTEIQRARYGITPILRDGSEDDFAKVAGDLILGMEEDQTQMFLDAMAKLFAEIGEEAGDPAWVKCAQHLQAARSEIDNRLGA